MIDAVIQPRVRPDARRGHIAEGVARAGRAAGADRRQTGSRNGFCLCLSTDGTSINSNPGCCCSRLNNDLSCIHLMAKRRHFIAVFYSSAFCTCIQVITIFRASCRNTLCQLPSMHMHTGRRNRLRFGIPAHSTGIGADTCHIFCRLRCHLPAVPFVSQRF